MFEARAWGQSVYLMSAYRPVPAWVLHKPKTYVHWYLQSAHSCDCDHVKLFVLTCRPACIGDTASGSWMVEVVMWHKSFSAGLLINSYS